MATLEQIYTIRYSTTGLLHRVQAAVMVAAAAIQAEDEQTSNHANRLLWAAAAMADPAAKAQQMLSDIALNATIGASFDPTEPDEGVPDGDIQFVVSSSVDKYATGEGA